LPVLAWWQGAQSQGWSLFYSEVILNAAVFAEMEVVQPSSRARLPKTDFNFLQKNFVFSLLWSNNFKTKNKNPQK
jgi:hypothetical protein